MAMTNHVNEDSDYSDSESLNKTPRNFFPHQSLFNYFDDSIHKSPQISLIPPPENFKNSELNNSSDFDSDQEIEPTQLINWQLTNSIDEKISFETPNLKSKSTSSLKSENSFTNSKIDSLEAPFNNSIENENSLFLKPTPQNNSKFDTRSLFHSHNNIIRLSQNAFTPSSKSLNYNLDQPQNKNNFMQPLSNNGNEISQLDDSDSEVIEQTQLPLNSKTPVSKFKNFPDSFPFDKVCAKNDNLFNPELSTNSATNNSKKSVSFEILNDDNFTAFPQSTIDSSQIIGSPPKLIASNIPISLSNEIYPDDCNSLVQETQLLPPQPYIDHMHHDHNINSSPMSNNSHDLKTCTLSSNEVYSRKTKNLNVNLSQFESFSEQVNLNKMEIDLNGSIDVVNETQFTTSTNFPAKITDTTYLNAKNNTPSSINILEKSHLIKPRIPETQYIDFDTVNDSQINFINDSNTSNFFQKSQPPCDSPKIDPDSQSIFIDPNNKCESIINSSTSDLNADDEFLHISGTRSSEIKTNSKNANNTPIHILSNSTILFEKEHIMDDNNYSTQTPVDGKSKN
ncbi:hypothetical protein AYI70_g10744, partial [Smittium culicis]